MNFVDRTILREPEIWLRILRRLPLSRRLAVELARRARHNHTGLATELCASGHVPPERLAQAVAAELRVAYVDELQPSDIVASDEQCAMLLGHESVVPPIRALDSDGSAGYILPTHAFGLARARLLLDRRPELRGRLRVASPPALRSALAAKARPALVRRACFGLAEAWPSCSARTVIVAWQAAFLSALVLAAMVAAVAAPRASLLTAHLFFSLFFLACVALRIWAVVGAAPPRLETIEPVAARDLPVYSVMVALYREAEIVPDLLVALGRLVWPRGKLEVKLVCEEDDRETLAVLEALQLRPWIEVVRVARHGPRTKPKALAYALPFTSGEFVALYDAEDRPHPLQLVEAWQRFAREEDDLACLQAPLCVSNPRESLVAASFAFEYAALFRGLLPRLAARSLILPLGGTSNHFRRAALADAGGWDPYNVTEDADIGMRLARCGYRTGMITLPTFEAAPSDWSVWLPQRTRWFKGWMQTWLVHMRHPAHLVGDLGFASFIVAQVLFAGMVASALVYPFFAATLLWLAASAFLDFEFATFHSAILLIDSANIALGYLAFILLGRQTLLPSERRWAWKPMLFMPVYWLMMSAAAWRGLWQLFVKPHHWEKTPHRPRARVDKKRGGGA